MIPNNNLYENYSKDSDSCPASNPFARAYIRLQQADLRLTKRYQALIRQIQPEFRSATESDSVCRRLKQDLKHREKTADEEILCRLEAQSDLRRQKILDHLLTSRGYNMAHHCQIQQAKTDLMAKRVNRIYDMMPEAALYFRDRYRTLLWELAALSPIGNRQRQAVLRLLNDWKTGLLSEADLLNRHLQDQAAFQKQRLAGILRAFSRQFCPSLKNDSDATPDQMTIRLFSLILGVHRRDCCANIVIRDLESPPILAGNITASLESHLPQILANSLAFLKYRTGRAPVRSLREADFRYPPGEYYKDGHFFHPACGQICFQSHLPPDRQDDYAYAVGSRLMTLGMQELLTRPAELTQSDPEYVAFMIANLSGELDVLSDRKISRRNRG